MPRSRGQSGRQQRRTAEADLAIAPAVSAHYDDIYLNDRLFEKISAVHEQIGGMALSAEQIRLTEQTYKQFVRAGAQLNARQKERLRDINRNCRC